MRRSEWVRRGACVGEEEKCVGEEEKCVGEEEKCVGEEKCGRVRRGSVCVTRGECVGE